jgi:hypothetical protein
VRTQLGQLQRTGDKQNNRKKMAMGCYALPSWEKEVASWISPQESKKEARAVALMYAAQATLKEG